MVVVEEGFDHEVKPRHPMEVIEQKDVGEALKVGQAGHEVGMDFDVAGDAEGSHGLDGHAGDVPEGGAQDADGAVGDVFGGRVHGMFLGRWPGHPLSTFGPDRPSNDCKGLQCVSRRPGTIA